MTKLFTLDELTEYDRKRIIGNPSTAEIPTNIVNRYAMIEKLAYATTGENFAKVKEYVVRFSPEMQILYLMLLIRRADVTPGLTGQPEYREWFVGTSVAELLVQ